MQKIKMNLDQFLDFLKQKGIKEVKFFVVNKFEPPKNGSIPPSIRFWVNVTAEGMKYILLQQLPHTAFAPSEIDMHNKNQRLQQNDFYMGKVYDLQREIEDKGFKVRIVNQLLR